jgi:hypothetical protein
MPARFAVVDVIGGADVVAVTRDVALEEVEAAFSVVLRSGIVLPFVSASSLDFLKGALVVF